MKVKCLSAEFVSWLKKHAGDNLRRYSSDNAWVEEEARAGGRIKESGVEVHSLPHLEMPAQGDLRDAENVRLLHSSMKRLTPLQAMDERLWGYLTHVHYAAYMQLRWKRESAGSMIDRYLFKNNGFGSLVRNGIARLWWFGQVTYDARRSDPYELTDVLLCNQDVHTALLQRSFGKSRPVLHAVLEHIRDNMDSVYADAIGSKIKTRAKRLNVLGGVSLLDAMPGRAIHEFLSQDA
jgi:hypothetical protein